MPSNGRRRIQDSNMAIAGQEQYARVDSLEPGLQICVFHERINFVLDVLDVYSRGSQVIIQIAIEFLPIFSLFLCGVSRQAHRSLHLAETILVPDLWNNGCQKYQRSRPMLL